jgi:hypothetical protein
MGIALVSTFFEQQTIGLETFTDVTRHVTQVMLSLDTQFCKTTA